MPAIARDRTTFTLPAVAGSYAPETYFVGDGRALLGITAVVETAPADAILEVWLRRLDQPAGVLGSYVNAGLSRVGAGFLTQALSSYPGAALRMKTGASAAGGAVLVNVSAD